MSNNKFNIPISSPALESWVGRTVTTAANDSLISNVPPTCYRGIIIEDDEEGHCKIDWIGEAKDILNYHFENKWINKDHFSLVP